MTYDPACHYGARVGVTAAQVAGLVAEGWTDRQIAEKHKCTRMTIWAIRRQFYISTTRPAPCNAPIWPLPDDVEAAWDSLLGPARYDNVPLLSATTIGQVRGALPTLR